MVSLVIERLMWGSDWNDPRLTALLARQRSAPTCAACDRPIGTQAAEPPARDLGRLLCARCAADQTD
jgi:hypothetical protein